MLFCTNCGTQLNEETRFCPGCGKAVASEQTGAAPQSAQIYVPAPTPMVAPYPAEVVVPTKSKVMGFISMGLGIEGLVLAVFGIFYTLIVAAAFSGPYYYENPTAFIIALYFSLFTLPSCIVGLVLSGKSSSCGVTTTPASVGKKLSIAGIIVTGVMLFIGFVAMLG